MRFTGKGNGSEMARFNSSGNFGIGTSNPAQPFVVQAEGTNQRGIELLPGSLSYIQAYDRAISDYGDLKIDAQTIRFGTDNGSERMRINSSGDLLVGTTDTTPYNNTSGNGIALGDGLITSAKDGGIAAIFNRMTSDGDVVQFRKGGTAVGSISVTASATAYNTSSDQRLKDNIVDAPSASDDIDALQVRSFDWKADGSHQKYGMVAQSLNTVAPDAVTEGDTEDDMMSVDYSKLVPMLVKEIQSLRARVAQLEGAN